MDDTIRWTRFLAKEAGPARCKSSRRAYSLSALRRAKQFSTAEVLKVTLSKTVLKVIDKLYQAVYYFSTKSNDG